MLDVVQVEHHRLGDGEPGAPLHVLEQPRHLDGLLGPLAGIGRQRAPEGIEQPGGQARPVDGGDRHLQDPQQQRGVAVGDVGRLLLRRPPRHQGVHRGGQRVDVGRRGDLGALQHLGRRVVAHRVVEGAEPREHRERRQPGLGHERLAVRPEHQAGGRQVAVDDARGVGRLERPGQQHAHLEGPLHVQGAVQLEQGVEGLGRLGVGDDPGPVVVGMAPLVDRDHARVHAEPLRRGRGPVEVGLRATLAQRGIGDDRHRATQSVARGGKQAARDPLPDEGEVTAPGYLRGDPSHDSGRIYYETRAGIAAEPMVFATSGG